MAWVVISIPIRTVTKNVPGPTDGVADPFSWYAGVRMLDSAALFVFVGTALVILLTPGPRAD
jgi:hypothetical protein